MSPMLFSPRRARASISSAVIRVCCLCLVFHSGLSTPGGMLQALKKDLRLDIMKKIKELPHAQKVAESNKVTDLVLNHPVYKQSKRISIYVSRDDEIDTRRIIENICTSGKQCFIPRYNKNEMKMLRLDSYEELDKLVKNKENIFQLSERKQTEDALDTGGLDLILLPGVAFTKDGKRLGRGKGYYDKYQEALKNISPNCRTMGLVFGCQLVEDLPMAEYDVPLHHVIHPLP